jgi:hypothetical protein
LGFGSIASTQAQRNSFSVSFIKLGNIAGELEEIKEPTLDQVQTNSRTNEEIACLGALKPAMLVLN